MAAQALQSPSSRYMSNIWLSLHPKNIRRVHGKDEVGMTCEGTGFFARKMLDSAYWLVPLVQRGILKSVQDEKDMFKAQPARTQQQQQQQQGIPLDILSFTLVAGF